MARYEKYKDSGIQWVGMVPDHWKDVPISALFREFSDKGHPNYKVLSVYREFGVIEKDSRDDNHNVTSENTESYKAVDVGDFVINKMKAWQGSMGVSDYKGIVSPAYITCRFRTGHNNKKFIHHLLRCQSYINHYNRLSDGVRVGQWDMHFEDFKRLRVFLPTKDEQNKIVSFIDSSLAEIDKAIAQQQRMIDLLNERKQIIIQNAVTKGLDTNVPMKDSGVDWVGKIPAHWGWTADKFIFRPFKTIVGKKAKEYTLLSLSKQGVIERDLENPTGKFPASFDTYQKVKPGDFIFCFFDNEETPRTVGLSNTNGMITGAYDVLRVINKEFDRNYLYYYFLNIDEAKRFRPLWRGLRKTIPFDSFMKYKIAQPPLEEQVEIANYLDSQTHDIDEGIAKMNKTIEALQERKRIIINEVVTGKIKVS